MFNHTEGATTLPSVVNEGQVILIRANSESNAVYVCDVHVSRPFIDVTYTDSNGHIVRFRYNPYQVPYQISVTMHNAYLPQGGELGQVLTKTGTGIDDVTWSDNVSAYTITSFTAVDVENQFDEALATDLYFSQQDITNLLRAVQENKTIIIHTDKGGVLEYYTCTARVNDDEFTLQYTNQNGQFITLATNLGDLDYYVNVSLLNSSLPIPESEGQVLTVTNIQRSNARGAINQVYDFEWADVPQGGGSIIVDKAMSDTSENPVQNKVIKKYVDDAKTYTIQSFTVKDITAAYHEHSGKGSILVNSRDGYAIKDAIDLGKIILIRVDTEDSSVYVCDAMYDSSVEAVYITYRDAKSHTVKLAYYIGELESDESEVRILAHANLLPTGGLKGQVLMKTGPNIDDVEWSDELNYILKSLFVNDIDHYFDGSYVGEGLFLSSEDVEGISNALSREKGVLIKKAGDNASEIYSCSVQIEDNILTIQYLNKVGQIITISTNLEVSVPTTEYSLAISLNNSALPVPQEEGQVLTVTNIQRSNIQRSNAGSVANQVYDFAWTNLPQSDNAEPATYVLPFTHEQVVEWANESPEGYVLSQEQYNEITEAILAKKVILVPTEVRGYFPCSANNDDMLYFSWLDNEGNVVHFSCDTHVDTIEITPAQSLPIGGSAGQVLTKTGEGIDDVEWQIPPTTTYVLPFTHEQVVEWANERPEGYVITREQYDEITEAILGKKVILVPTEFGGYFPCSANNDDMLYFSWLDNEGNVVHFSCDTHVDTIEITPAQSLPIGGSAGQVLAKRSDESFDAEWVDAPTPSVEIEVDPTMSETSTNPVQNKVVKSYIDNAIGDVESNQIEVEEVTSLPNSPMKGERLILEWSNEDAEVLQPVSYDSATGYFIVEQMPSWLYKDGQIVNCVPNYSESILWSNTAINNVPFSTNNSQPTQYIKRVSSTEFKVLSQQSEANSQVSIITNPDCSQFFYTNAYVVARLPLQDEDEDAPVGVRKYRVVVSDSSLALGNTFNGVNSSKSYVTSNAYHRYLGYRFVNENRCFGVSGEFTFEVDYDNGKYRYLGYIISGINRTSATSTSEYVQRSNNTERWSDMWGFNKTNADSMGKAYFLLSASALTKSCKVKIYEIYGNSDSELIIQTLNTPV